MHDLGHCAMPPTHNRPSRERLAGHNPPVEVKVERCVYVFGSAEGIGSVGTGAIGASEVVVDGV
jgi:hypothetical protein